MIKYIPEETKPYSIEKPSDIMALPIEVRNRLKDDIKKGEVYFKLPLIVLDKKAGKAYKVGFLYDCLTLLNPTLNKTEKWGIISEEYHFMFTYRQFKDILDYYIEHLKKE